jgi:hypothetical protein
VDQSTEVLASAIETAREDEVHFRSGYKTSDQGVVLEHGLGWKVLFVSVASEEATESISTLASKLNPLPRAHRFSVAYFNGSSRR